ncbi:MAG: hypothetical protein D6775_04015 [Caldilineae bacterium]|nr:MAG: hypothetical protein D6775_04015 [Caldilineae bacterium]
MILGIGYLPTRTGPALWQKFDRAEIADDLAHIAALGFQAVRVPLFWADFQPAVDRIDARAFDRFERFLTLAQEEGLQVTGGLWTGIWDGALWWPDWGVTPAPLPPHWPLLVNNTWVRWGRIRHPFTDERMLGARQLLVDELVAHFRSHPALSGWEPLPGFGRLAAATERQAIVDWLGSTNEVLQAAAAECPCTYLLAIDALETASGIWPDEVVAAGGEPSLSIATFASDRRRLPLNSRWIAFALDLTRALAGRPVSLHLAGLPTAAAGERSEARDGVYYANEEEAAAHLAEVIAIARQRGCPALWLWRWADIPEERWNQPPYDRPNWRRHTGLLRADGSEKKLVEALQQPLPEVRYPELSVDTEAYRADPPARFQELWYEFQEMAGG